MHKFPFLIENVDLSRIEANLELDPSNRSSLGQYMTPSPVARFMASLFSSLSLKNLRLLDPGAGVGSLTAAFVQEVFNRQNLPQHLSITAFEIDPVMQRHLKNTLTECEKMSQETKISASVVAQDFLQAGHQLLSDELSNPHCDSDLFTHAILNPPYKKLPSKSLQKEYLKDLGVDVTNLYAAFLVVAIRLLKPGGELVAIIPRSFCNGPYFKAFRKFLIDNVAFKRIHVFESRSHAFKDDEVLQENVILHLVKGARQGSVIISSSMGADFSQEQGEFIAEDMMVREVAFTDVVKPKDSDQFIHVATTGLDQLVVDRLSSLTTRYQELGVTISTGPVVDFRIKDELEQEPSADSIPLLYAHHFEEGRVYWPKKSKKPNAIRISEETKRWLMVNRGYFVTTKRFSSKEEKRRVVACVYDSSLPGDYVGFENHLNVFHANKQGFSKALAYGLAAFLNSTLVDKYFRQFSGHTQVNASDLKSLHYPSKEALEKIGAALSDRIPSQNEVDEALNKQLNLMNESSNDPLEVQKKIDEALEVVKAIGMPRAQQNDRSALTLLALLNLKPGGSWKEIDRPMMGITPVMEFCDNYYGKRYAPNSRETFRRQTMHQFVEAGIAVYNPDKPERPVNSPHACYQVSPEAYELLTSYGTSEWKKALAVYLEVSQTLEQKYARARNMQLIQVKVADDQVIKLSPGLHSQLIKDIIEEFGPRFAPGSSVIYVGDTGAKKDYFDRETLSSLGVNIDEYGKMPDVVLYYKSKGWLLLIESVTSHGPVDAKRHGELSKLFEKSTAGLVFVTAFPSTSVMGKYLSEICWETEVWVADSPTHMIHFNGERFLGPYDGQS